MSIWYFCLLILLTVQNGRSEVLTENFVIRLKDMEKIIRDQREVIANLSTVVEEASLKNIVQEQRELIRNCSNSFEEIKGNQITIGNELTVHGNKIKTLEDRTNRLETGRKNHSNVFGYHKKILGD